MMRRGEGLFTGTNNASGIIMKVRASVKKICKDCAFLSLRSRIRQSLVTLC